MSDRRRSIAGTIAGALVGGFFGVCFSSFGLIDTGSGFRINFDLGNELTPVLSGAGGLIGAVLGAIPFVRRHWPVPVGAFLGLLAYVIPRDRPSREHDLEPSFGVPPGPSTLEIVVRVFGPPVLGALVGFLVDRALHARRGEPAAR